jgi:phosphoribosylglycinamide formyltransferase-1
MKRLGILISGRGSNFQAIADSIDAGRLPAEIAVVISNRESAPGLEVARTRGLNAICLPSKGLDRTVYDRQLIDELNRNQVDLVCLAGYLRLLSAEFIQAFSGRILNIHPSLLPAFPGLDAQHQALEYGVKIAGCTVHFVDEHLDSGPIILQTAVPVLDDDTDESLSARILEQEHRIYTDAIRIVLSAKYKVVGRRVVEFNRPSPIDDPLKIPGANDVINWFGYWPTFHDAEVLSIAFDRSSGCRVVLRALKGRSDATAIVIFALEGFPTDKEGIVNTRLAYFNAQNVLSQAWIEESPEGYVLVLHGIYGVTGRICCNRLSITIQSSDT